MTKAIEAGLPKLRIEEASARRQARIDSGRETIVGLTKYRLEKEEPLDILDIDNTAVREAQIRKLEILRKNRDNTKVRQILEEITKCSRNGQGQPARTQRRGGKGARKPRRNFARVRKGLRTLQGGHPLD